MFARVNIRTRVPYHLLDTWPFKCFRYSSNWDERFSFADTCEGGRAARQIEMPTQLRKQGNWYIIVQTDRSACWRAVIFVVKLATLMLLVHCPRFSTDAHMALELLERYRNKLNDPADQNLRDSITRAINAIRSRLFQALVGECTCGVKAWSVSAL